MANSKWGKRPGFVLDTGALIDLERWDSKLFKELAAAEEADRAVLVPAPVLVEWLAGRPLANTRRVFDLIDVVELDASQSQLAGKALAGVGHPACTACGVRGGPSVVDAVVMALAHEKGDTVFTQDPTDLRALQDAFPRAIIATL